jgi:hypothetical protein
VNFLKNLNTGIKSKCFEDGMGEQNAFDLLWQEMGSKEIATVYITVLTSALNYIESKFNENNEEIDKYLDFTIDSVKKKIII